MPVEAVNAIGSLPDFSNEKLVDFSNPEIRRKMQAALDEVKKQLGREYPLVIGGQKVTTEGKLKSLNPSRQDEVVGVFAKATAAQADEAVRSSDCAFESWKRTSVDERVAWLLRVAKEMRERKFELSAWMVYEVGKTWPEADADTAEAIDFCEFYAREALRLQSACAGRVTPVPGEKNELCYIPLGVAIVIPPWNFPLAIAAGMAAAAIVSGNTVVLKPSSDSPTIAYKMCEIMWAAGLHPATQTVRGGDLGLHPATQTARGGDPGLPAGVLNFLPGSGAVMGDELVKHPRTRFVAFTGSKEVGLHINELAAKHQPGQIWIKRVIAEMGGKDSIVVDNEADLDTAADAVTASAFGYQGQKCSACSRAIVVDAVYDAFLEKLKSRVETITVGESDNPDVYMGPVVNESAMKSILNYIDIGKKEGRVVTGGARAGEGGYFIQPTVIADVPPQGKVSQEEIFGPVLAVVRAKDYDDALAIANNTEYGLTGAVFSNNREKLERARQEFHAGNLYLNRKCTGAWVGGHPFGGFNMSGTDSKAGGKDYLLLFTQAKLVSEKA